MLRWTVIFLIIALTAVVSGFGDMAGNTAVITKFLILAFITVFTLSLVFGSRPQKAK